MRPHARGVSPVGETPPAPTASRRSVARAQGARRRSGSSGQGRSWLVRAAWLVAMVTLGAGCALDSRTVGAPCVDELDCSSGSFCSRQARFPDGVCTVRCGEDFACRSGASCVDLEGGLCLRDCEGDVDCEREGYRCQEVPARDVAGRVSVCVGG